VAAFGLPEAEGLVAIVALLTAAVVGAKGALEWRSRQRETALVTAHLDDFNEREEINRLRHRDFDAFVEKLNARRARRGDPAIAKEALRPHQYNLMYSVEAADIDREELGNLKKRVETAVKEGDDPFANAPLEP
jgi:hypothetical protein